MKVAEELNASLSYMTQARAPVGLDVHQLLACAHQLDLPGRAFDLHCKIGVTPAGGPMKTLLEFLRRRAALQEAEALLRERLAEVRVHLVEVVCLEKREEGFSITL